MTLAAALPETRYAESDGLSIAYQVFGSGTRDLLIVPGIVSNLDANWQHYKAYARMMRQFAQQFRVIVFDKRGQGLSDHFDGAPTLEQRMDDVRAVMTAAGCQQAVLLASSEGGAMAALFTTTYPALVHKLILYGTMARFAGAPDYPHMPTLELHLQALAHSWGKPIAVRGFAPSMAKDPESCENFARYQRQAASPSSVRQLTVANAQIDVRAILPQIRRPTLILQQRGDRIVGCANGRYLADHVPGALYLELPGKDHVFTDENAEAIVDAVGRFASADWVDTGSDQSGRWLATVLFTDIVGSTEHAARLGDRAWSELLQKFHAMGRVQLERHRGREIDTAGDGLFATFDGPARAIRCAGTMSAEAKQLGFELRAGLHTGEVETTDEKVSGMAVHIGARVMALAGAGEVLVSSTVKDLVAGSGIEFEALGARSLKGVPGEWHLHRALAASGSILAA
jgi:pimeloyl-ACP methyl ester carboxylesterase